MLQMSEHQGEVLYSRYNDGARPVRVLDDGWEVLREGKLTKFTTAQGLLKELTGHPTGRHWSLERYFGLGAHAPKADKLIGQANVLDLFAPPSPQLRPTRSPCSNLSPPPSSASGRPTPPSASPRQILASTRIEFLEGRKTLGRVLI